jgi:hypothetical protein
VTWPLARTDLRGKKNPNSTVNLDNRTGFVPDFVLNL